MKRKKPFEAPRVIQNISVQLEKDLLGASIQEALTITSMGIAVDHYDFSEEIDNNPYGVYWE